MGIRIVAAFRLLPQVRFVRFWRFKFAQVEGVVTGITREQGSKRGGDP